MKAMFFLLVFACTGGAGWSASNSLKEVATKLCALEEVSYPDIMSYRRIKLNFALLRSPSSRFEASMTFRRHEIIDNSMRAVIEEGGMSFPFMCSYHWFFVFNHCPYFFTFLNCL